MVTEDTISQTLDPLPVQVIPGIGKVTLEKLRGAGIDTVGDLRAAPEATLERCFGRYARRMRERAGGIDDRPVVSSREEKSISAEQTFDTDLADRESMEAKLLELTERTTTRLRAKSLACGTVQVKIREADFTTHTRQRALRPPSNGTDQVYAAARELLAVWLREHPGARLRLLGVGGAELSPALQQDLFGDLPDGRKSELDQTVDDIRQRFGKASVGRARSLDGEQIR